MLYRRICWKQGPWNVSTIQSPDSPVSTFPHQPCWFILYISLFFVTPVTCQPELFTLFLLSCGFFLLPFGLPSKWVFLHLFNKSLNCPWPPHPHMAVREHFLIQRSLFFQPPFSTFHIIKSGKKKITIDWGGKVDVDEVKWKQSSHKWSMWLQSPISQKHFKGWR